MTKSWEGEVKNVYFFSWTYPSKSLILASLVSFQNGDGSEQEQVVY